ncbi:MAG: glycosyl transferase, family 2 [Halobacteriovorax sp.]|nr:glycosyl transferase, family 2 [Halobacteriovorax sp.]|tara:strand:- start:226578 stop:227282 length:705 start_codon:yes stop_codon:yes gene_type:complete
MPKISIVIPINNDFSNGKIREQIEVFEGRKDIEVIYVDGGSNDGSLEFLSNYDVKIISLKDSNRAERIARGIQEASSSFLLLHHPRSYIESSGLDALFETCKRKVWGGLTHRFDTNHYLLNFTSWYSNQVRAKIRGILYLDHCIFFHKDLLEDQSALPTIEIFEDTAISELLLTKSHPILIPFTSTTSAIRFKKNGIWKQAILNQIMKICWYLKVSPSNMNKIYEKGLELNSKI